MQTRPENSIERDKLFTMKQINNETISNLQMKLDGAEYCCDLVGILFKIRITRDQSIGNEITIGENKYYIEFKKPTLMIYRHKKLILELIKEKINFEKKVFNGNHQLKKCLTGNYPPILDLISLL